MSVMMRLGRLRQTEPVQQLAKLQNELGIAKERRAEVCARLGAAVQLAEDLRAKVVKLATEGAQSSELASVETDLQSARTRELTLRTAAAELEDHVARLDRQVGALLVAEQRERCARELRSLAKELSLLAPEIESILVKASELMLLAGGAVPEAMYFGRFLENVRDDVAKAQCSIQALLLSTVEHVLSGHRSPVSLGKELSRAADR